MKTAAIVIIALLLVGAGIYAYRTSGPVTDGINNNVVCTMDAKLCPDGSYVGRIGPKCEFAACPGVSSGLMGTVISNTSSTSTTTSTSSQTAPKALTVNYTDSGFSPRTAIIAKGGKITFVNKSSARMHVASDPHPQHTNYPDFDQGSSIGSGGTWTFTFNQTGSWGYHDHLNPNMTGTVVVQ
jgi:plastocyanin